MATQTTMSVKDALLADFDHEMTITRKHLEAIPDDKLAWAPHDKSMTLARLGSHLAEAPGWTGSMTDQDEFDIAPTSGDFKYEPPTWGSAAEMLENFDKNVSTAREQIGAKSDADLMSPWSFKMGGQTLFTVPKVEAIQSHVIKHAIHHRGQISVYLRLVGAQVPQTYGPTADFPDK